LSPSPPNSTEPNQGQSSLAQVASAGIHPPQVIGIGRRRKADEPQNDEERDIHKAALDRFRLVQTYESNWRTKAQNELNFLAGEHWDPTMKSERQGRPCLVFDKIGPAVMQVVNDTAQSPPEAQISPVGAGADKDTAEILEGILRNIDQDSSAEDAYMTAYKPAVAIGRAWWRVNFEWESNDGIDLDSFQQKIVVCRIANPFSVYPDPASDQWDYSDMRFCFVTEDVDKETFEDMYPEAASAGFGEFTGVGDNVRTEWYPEGAVRIAEYWWVETDYEEIALLRNGAVVPKAKADPNLMVAHRRVEKRHVRMAKITGMGIIEITDWPGQWIPLVPVLGEEIIKNGKRELIGMVRMSMDANLQYDYMRSKEAEAIGLAPISQWLVAEGQIENYETAWGEANRKPFAYLTYKAIGDKDNPIPPPIRINAEPAVQAISQAILAADQDIKATTSTYDPTLGGPQPEQSGKAINLRQRQADNAHFHYRKNLARAMQHDARIKLDLIPHVYSQERVMQIVNPDGSVKKVEINRWFQEGVTKKIFKIGISHSPARYDVTIGTGMSYASRRERGADQLMQLAQAIPQVMARGLDIIVRMLDLPQGDELADRLRPPDVPPDSDDQPPIPPQVQAQLVQQQNLINAMTQQLQKLTQMIEMKKLDLESKERIATQNNIVNLIVAELQNATDQGIALTREQFASFKHRLDLLQEGQSIDADVQMQQSQQQHEQGMQQADQQHQQDMATQAQQAQKPQPTAA